MFRINFNPILRNMRKTPWLTGIKISGLVIGITCSILVYLFVSHELSYDKFNINNDRIYRIAVKGLIGNTDIHQTYTCAPLPKALYNEFPEIESVVRLSKSYYKVKYRANVFYEKNTMMADSTLFDIFTLPLVKGNARKALSEPNSVVVTESYAKKVFKGEDPMGQTLILNDELTCKVSGIMKDIPENSHFHFDFVVSLITEDYSNSTSWWNNNFQTYILLKKGSDPKQLEAKFPGFVSKYLFERSSYSDWTSKGNKWIYYLQPLTSIHLNSDLSGELEPNGNLDYVRMFIIVGIFILFIACVNYMNLTTARASNRANEIGIKKVIGSGKSILARQFMGESVLVTVISLIIAILLVKIVLPLFNHLLDKNLHFSLFMHYAIIPTLLTFGVVVGVISGSYPAFYLSSINPIKVLKGGHWSGTKNSGFRNLLVIVQFTISVALIVGTLIINKQLNFIKNERLGFDKDQVLVVKNRLLINKDDKVLRDELMQSPYISDVSFSHTIPGGLHNNIGFSAEQIDGWFTMNVCVCDAEYKKVMSLQMAEGRFFSDEIESDKNAIVINEATAKLCGYPDGSVGKTFSEKYKVIGVVKDYHYESMHQKVRPMVLINARNKNWMNPDYMSVKLKGEHLASSINFIRKIWDENSNGYPFEYTFLDASYDQLYKNEQQTSSLFLVFSVLAIFIACLGLIGLSSFVIERRIKEIGVRKVNGAKIQEVMALLNKDFIKWVVVAFITAYPIAWYAMHKWLENFAYKTELSWWIFALAGSIALIIALLTVSWQSWRAASRNPVEALRYE